MANFITLVSGIGLSYAIPNILLAADVTAGEQKAKTCFVCHGQMGPTATPKNLYSPTNKQPLSNQLVAFRVRS